MTLNSNLQDYVKIIQHNVGSITIAANTGTSVQYTPPTVAGYKYILQIGGKGEGNVGLVISTDSSWLFNASNAQKTFNVTYYLMYIKL